MYRLKAVETAERCWLSACKQTRISCACMLPESFLSIYFRQQRPSVKKCGSQLEAKCQEGSRRQLISVSGQPLGIPRIRPVFQKWGAIYLILGHLHPGVGLTYCTSSFLENIQWKSQDMSTWRESLHLFKTKYTQQSFIYLGWSRNSQKLGAHL